MQRSAFAPLSRLPSLRSRFLALFASPAWSCRVGSPVRREIRALTTADRERYFAALEVVHRLSLDEGQAM